LVVNHGKPSTPPQTIRPGLGIVCAVIAEAIYALVFPVSPIFFRLFVCLDADERAQQPPAAA
jgi:hypothetical protein